MAAIEPRSTGETRLLAGVDEAGLGPMLGPLTFGWSVFRAPREKTTDLWAQLGDAVSRDPKRDAERIIVDDSKIVFTRNPRGERRLERTALSFLSLLREGRRPPACATELLEGPLAVAAASLARHPWYAELEFGLPRTLDPGGLELTTEHLHRVMTAAGVKLEDAGVRVVPAGELNASYAETENKSTTVWHVLTGVLRHLWERFGTEHPAVVVDRQGGRVHYGGPLARSFPDARVRQLGGNAHWSEYELEGRGADADRGMRVLFAERAEQGSLPVALASCLAKYTRESCMAAFNAYWCAKQPGLKPTAGYTTDGRRWMAEAEFTLQHANLPDDILVRRR